GAGVQPAAVYARIDERAEPDVRNDAGRVARNGSEQVRHHALRKAIRFEGFGHRKALHTRAPVPMAANRPAHQPFVREPVDTAALAVTHAAGMNDCETRWMAHIEEPRFECGEH